MEKELKVRTKALSQDLANHLAKHIKTMGNPTNDWNAGCVDPIQTLPPPRTLVLLYPYIPEGTTAMLSKVWTCTPVSLTFCSLLYKELILVKGFQFWSDLPSCEGN